MWIAGAFFIVLFIWHLSKKRLRDAVTSLPGPYCLPILGSILAFPTLNSKNIIERLDKSAARYGPVIKMWVFNHLFILSADAELNGQLLSDSININKLGAYRVLKPSVGEGLLASNGKKWRARRKIITPTFNFKIIEQYVQIFDQQANILVNCLKSKADGRTAFNIYPYMCAATLDATTESAMGVKLNSQTDPNQEYTKAINEACRPYAHNELLFSLLYPHLKWRQTKLCKILHDFSIKIIKERRQALQQESMSRANNNSIFQETDYKIGNKSQMNLLDLLLQSRIDGELLSNEEIREELHAFTGAGQETTATLLSFASYLLARHPEVQNNLLAELDSAFGAEKKEIITHKDLNSLKYMECVIKETLRLYPSVPLIARCITEDLKYKHSQYGEGVIPAGAEFVINIYRAMHDPIVFKNPYEFIPERHNNAADSKFAFIPFSAGPRNCIGQKYAMYQAKLFLAKLIREYEFLPFGENVVLQMDVVMRSTTGMQCGLRPRSQNC